MSEKNPRKVEKVSLSVFLFKKKMQMKTEIFVKTKGLQATVLNVTNKACALQYI